MRTVIVGELLNIPVDVGVFAIAVIVVLVGLALYLTIKELHV